MIWEADILYKHLEFHTTTVYKVALINGSVMVQWKKACPISIEVILLLHQCSENRWMLSSPQQPKY